MRATLLALGVSVTLAGSAAADPFEDFGTSMKYGLPLAAAVCAVDQDRFEDFAIRGAAQALIVLGLKAVFDSSDIGMRPSGLGRGFPSGHAAAAGFGAGDLASKCFDDKPELGAAVYGAAGLAAVSRVHAGEHTPTQVLAGSLIGISFGAASFGFGSQGASFGLGLRF
jgi:membrane-associated phospholipid phosphatase